MYSDNGEIGTVPSTPGYIVTLLIKDPSRQQGRQKTYRVTLSTI